jgi:hypothetical protein
MEQLSLQPNEKVVELLSMTTTKVEVTAVGCGRGLLGLNDDDGQYNLFLCHYRHCHQRSRVDEERSVISSRGED